MKHSIKSFQSRRGIVLLVSVVTVVAILGAGIYGAANVWPSFGARNVDTLRALIGDPAVARLETVMFQSADGIQQAKYRLGLNRPAAPWGVTPVGRTHLRSIRQGRLAILASLIASTPAHTEVAPPVATALSAASTTAPTEVPPTVTAMPTSTPTLTPTPTPPTRWIPAPMTAPATGKSLPGEGRWFPYLKNASGQIVAYRAFLHPDPYRPYAVAGIVAFDLNAIRLHFVLGSKEPISTVHIKRSGHIRWNDLRPGVLLATFNGGFKARHGHFGVMVNGVTVLPPRVGLGTIALYKDGGVRIGQWGKEITPSAAIQTWRQNGPLIIHNGQANPHTADYAPQDWGYTVHGAVAVWRSGVGISADGHTLYYVAGKSLTLPALTETFTTSGAYQAMQLDINAHWVSFGAISFQRTHAVAKPLLNGMQQNRRYVLGYWRDYFYVTVHDGQPLALSR